jgi:hypothetical protein
VLRARVCSRVELRLPACCQDALPLLHPAVRQPPRTVRSLPQGILDPALELAKLEKKCGEVAGRIEALHKKMALPAYADKTPAAVKEEDADKLAKAQAELAAAQAHAGEMRKMAEEGQAGQAGQQ